MAADRRTDLHVVRERNRSVHQAFEAIADQQPEALALWHRAGRYSYAALDRAASNLARRIMAETAARFVVSLIEEPRFAIVTFLAISKAGKAWAPVQRHLPRETLQAYIDLFEQPIIVTDTRDDSWPISIGLPVIDVREIDLAAETERVSLTTNPSALFGVFPTSGTTGIPKGVQRSHCDQISRTFLETVANEVSPADRILITTSFAFGSAVAFTLKGLLNGAAVFVLDPNRDGREAILRLIREARISVILLMTSFFRALFGHSTQTYPGIRSVRLGGEPVLARDLDTFRRVFDRQASLVNLYAGTEFGIACTFTATHDTVLETATVPVGKALPGTSITLLDPGGEPAPGDIGEIQITSREITEGYWKAPELDDPTITTVAPGNHDDQRPKRSYRSGDLGRLLPDGNLVHLGRIDRQVKIRGFRIDLAAIENRLFFYPSVTQALVLPHDLPGGETLLVAYLEFDPTRSRPTIDQLRRHLAEQLAPYMIPSRFVVLDRIPLLANGKINQRALPTPEEAESRTGRPFMPPRTPTEQTVADIWQGILASKQPIGRDDDFFEIGATSLNIMGFLVEVSTRMEKTLTPEQIVGHPTIAQLAALIDSGSEESSPTVAGKRPACIVPLQTCGKRPPLFCIPGSVGNPLVFKHLAIHLGTDQPVYALQPQGSDGLLMPHDSIEAWAAHYTRAIIDFAGNRMINILGFSGGGVVAMEVARQLRQRNIEPGWIFLGDTHFPGKHSRIEYYSIEIPMAIKHALRLGRRFLRRLFDSAHRGKPLHQTNDIKEIRDRLYRFHRRAANHYNPTVYHGRVVYLLARQSSRRSATQANSILKSWRSLVSGTFVAIGIDAPHELMAEPQVMVTAAHIKRIMATPL